MRIIKIISSVVVCILISAFTLQIDIRPFRDVNNVSFTSGETLLFKVHVGPVNAGTSTMRISDTIYEINNRPCYKIAVEGRTTGFFDLFLRVRDEWGTFLDTTAIIPHRFYRNIEEGKYRKYEVVDFDHREDTALVSKLDKKTRRLKEQVPFKIENNSQDLVSGYYFIRTLDYQNYHEGDTINVPAFFDDETYNFSMRYLGIETVKTKLGKIDALVLSPIMPENSIFDGEDAVQVWLSNDKNKVPLKVKAKMWVGAVEIDILEAMNLRSPLAYVD